MTNNSESKLLSIVIPTKDRYVYLFQLIQLIDSYSLNDIEIVIQDNSSDNAEMLQFLNSNNFKNLKYFYTSEVIPISQNIDLALSRVNSEYVCLIGDDDGVLPNVVNCVMWMKQKNIDALRSSITVYNWPDYTDFSSQKLSGALLYDKFSFQYSEIDCIASLKNLSLKGFRHIYSIPKVYQGIVKKKCLDEIYKIGGTYVPGVSPDMANAVALSFVIKKFVTINIPVVLTGQSVNTGGGEKKLKSHVLEIENVTFLPKDAKKKWHKNIPRVWCSQTVWPESALSAIKYMGKEKEIPVNYDFILAWFIHTHPYDKHLAYLLPHNRFRLIFYLLYFRWGIHIKSKLYSFIGSSNKKIALFEGRQYIKREMTTIKDAVNYLMQEHAKYLSFDQM